jgi:hypothetical protein
MAAGARDGAPTGANPIGVNDAGAGVSTDCGDNRFHVEGRSFVIHALWNGLVLVLFAGAEDRETATAAWLRAGAGPCIGSAYAPAAAPDHAAGSGAAAAATVGRNAEPVIRATNTPSAAATAMAGCHRLVSPTRRKTTVH